jgi:hypothetical protein
MWSSVGALIVVVGFVFGHSVWLTQDVPVTSAADEGTEIAKLKAEIDELKDRLPSQSHAMMDVGYHFSNLWFAGQGKNWDGRASAAAFDASRAIPLSPRPRR